MLLTQPYYRLALRVEVRADPMLRTANSAGVLLIAFRIALEGVQHLVESPNVRKQGMIGMPPLILAVQLAVVIHLDGYHARAVYEPLFFVHDHFGRFFPTTNDPFTGLVKTHGHGILLGATVAPDSAADYRIHPSSFTFSLYSTI